MGMILCVCLNMVCVCLWGVARGMEDLSGVIQASDDSGQGELREIDVKAIKERYLLPFPFMKMKVSLKPLVSIALCGSCRSVKSASRAHTQPFAEEPLIKIFWHQ